ncbi:BZIP domain-containing protein [Plasmodiophora brassicae]
MEAGNGAGLWLHGTACPVINADDAHVDAQLDYAAEVTPTNPGGVHIPTGDALAQIRADRQREVLMRMATKAERARRSRVKRKAYVADLEAQVQAYTERLAALQAEEARLDAERQHEESQSSAPSPPVPPEQALDDKFATLINTQRSILDAIVALDVSSPDADLSEAKRLLAAFKDITNQRAAMCESYLDLAEKILSFGSGVSGEALWVLCCQNSGQDEEGGLLQQLELSTLQRNAIESFSEVFVGLETRLRHIINIMRRYKTHCRAMTQTRNAEVGTIVSLTGTRETVRILNWIEKQTWCMELLSSLFDQYVMDSLSDFNGNNNNNLGNNPAR